MKAPNEIISAFKADYKEFLEAGYKYKLDYIGTKENAPAFVVVPKGEYNAGTPVIYQYKNRKAKRITGFDALDLIKLFGYNV